MNFTAALIQQGYTLYDDLAVFMKPEYTGIAYSDGDETEARIADIIHTASDLTIFSRELAQHCTDWPLLYHLGSNRANILRPFNALLKQADVLEIGAGCGAITRFLGESGANVLALEGSPRRAAIAKSRTRDLENVTVLAERFDQFLWDDNHDDRFDVITLIGVLEYAAMFTDASHPALSMLRRVRKLLKPEGKLILAIENQLGLKYFAGAAEDHTGEPMLGIEGRYRDKGPRTFGRKVLEELLEQAGFFSRNWMAPFPDYKLPVSIVTEQGFTCGAFDTAAFCWQSIRHDPQLPFQLMFAPELAWSVVDSNKLTLDLANSLLIIASSAPKNEPFDLQKLAYHYSTNNRRAEYCKETFFEQENDNIILTYNSLKPDPSYSFKGKYIEFDLPQNGKYIQGELLALQLIKIIIHDDWNIEDIGIFLKKYLNIIQSFLFEKGQIITFESVTTLLPGICFDIIPQNIVCLSDGTHQIIDQEWILKDDMPLGWLLFRALQPLICGITRLGRSTSTFPKTWFGFLTAALKAAGLSVTKKELEDIVVLENRVQAEIRGFEMPLADDFPWGSSLLLHKHPMQDAFKEREQRLATAQLELVSAHNKIQTLQKTMTNLQNQMHQQEYQYRISQLKSKLDLQDLQSQINSLVLYVSRVGAVSCRNNRLPFAISQQHNFLRKAKFILDRLSRNNRIQFRQLKQLIKESPLFDDTFYLQADSTLAASKKDPLQHYFFRGAEEGRNPNPYFFTSWYLTQYPDVAASGINPLLHFLMYGAKEGRNPNPYFFTAWYTNKYLQTKEQRTNPLLHYIQYGWKMGAWPNPYFDTKWYTQTYLPTDQSEIEPLAHFLWQSPEINHNPNPYFDSQWYLQTYPWVQKMGMHPLQHYIAHGAQEQINPNPYFDSRWYARQYPDAIAEGMCSFAHYLAHVNDGKVNPNPYFDAEWYRASYPDIEENGVDHFLHYIIFGAKEYRNPGPYFNTSWYLEKYPDVKKSGMNPLLHFLQFGAFECRDPHPDFDTKWYINNYPEILETGLTPLLHYIQKGKSEGKLPYDPERIDNQFDLDKIFGDALNDHDNEYIPLLHAPPLKDKVVKLIAFYLPQFHPFPENDKWWGVGFTEWTNVKPAQAQFQGHYQPHIPGELGYYNLTNPSIQHRQIELAKLYGIEGFCFYFYWFAGKILMETPTANYLSDKSLDFPFCLCWANENWTRRWDGKDQEILIEQQHSPEDDINFIKYISQYLRDSRYIRIENKPLILMYRPELLPSAKDTVKLWREWCRNNEIGEIYLAYTQSFCDTDPRDFGFDAAIEFPPSSLALNSIDRNAFQHANVNCKITPTDTDFNCTVTDWRIFLYNSTKYKSQDYQLFRGVCPSWDNTPRRKNSSSIFLHSTPRLYKKWLKNAIDDTIKNQNILDERLIFINAWNEWGEGAYLEPDDRYGYAYLDATRRALLLTDSRYIDDEKYFSMLIRSIENPLVDGIQFPGFPNADIQKGFVGSSNQTTLEEAYHFFRLVKRYAVAFGKKFTHENYNFLDFGCGWGRFLRFFQKDINPKNIYGVDVDPNIINTCRDLGFICNLSPINPTGLLPYKEHFFDCIIAYSVFTHLPENVHQNWLKELSRVSKPGCVIALTLESIRFLDFISSIDETLSLSRWHEKLAKFKDKIEKMKLDFNQGKFVYLPTGGGAYRDSNTYGDAAVPLSCIERHWGHDFNIIEYIDDGSFWQAVLVVQKK